MRIVAEAMLSSAPAESRMRSRADVPVLGPDDRQVVAAALVQPFETCRPKQCPATWGVWTYAGLLLADCGAEAVRSGNAVMRRHIHGCRKLSPVARVGPQCRNGGQRTGRRRPGPLVGARVSDRCALALISLALDEVDAA
jgi:hypothetical protein